MFGKPGKYISMENGPIADSNPSISMRKKCFFVFMSISLHKQNYDTCIVIRGNDRWRVYKKQ
jgi:hypothetical protein